MTRHARLPSANDPGDMSILALDISAFINATSRTAATYGYGRVGVGGSVDGGTGVFVAATDVEVGFGADG